MNEKMKQYLDLLEPELNEHEAYAILERICGFHRIQATPGFSDAANACAELLEEQGIHTNVLPFPADGHSNCTTRRVMREWHCKEAWCEVEGVRIADFSAAPMSLIARSAAWNKPQEMLELVMVTPDMPPLQGDLQGKLIFAHDMDPLLCDYAIQLGAAGVLTDYVTNREEHYQVLRSTAFWWHEEDSETKYFGFVISPMQGDALAARCLSAAAENRSLTAKCYVDAEFCDGSLTMLEASIPGTNPEEEILLMAHLCHPRPSANDNASGCAALAECMLALQRIITRGALPRPCRTIRALFLPEMSGSYEYAAAMNPERKALAAFNLDMVGGKQSLGIGPLTLTLLPYCCPSFVGDLADMLLHEVSERYEQFSQEGVPLNVLTSEFHGGSDHSIFSDPTVGVPCLMLGQWPDPYYHTSGDTPDRVSPSTLKASALIAASYSAILASFQAEHIPDILGHTACRMVTDLESIRSSNRMGKINDEALARALNLRLKYYLELVDSVGVFCSDQQSSTLIATEKDRFAAIGAAFGANAILPKASGDTRVFERTFIGPIDDSLFAAKSAGCVPLFQSYLKNHRYRIPGFIQCEIQTQYYIDGKRTVEEIIAQVLTNLPYGDREGILAYFAFLEAANLIRPIA